MLEAQALMRMDDPPLGSLRSVQQRLVDLSRRTSAEDRFRLLEMARDLCSLENDPDSTPPPSP